MKRKIPIIFVSIKNLILPTLFVLFTLCLILFSNENLAATKHGLSLWVTAVVPSLLPFFIATELLGHTHVVSSIGNFFNRFMRPIFHVPGIGGYAFLMGIISGYPVGAKIVTKFREDGLCTKAEAERLVAFTNNSGPLFIIGTVGISLFGNTQIGILLFITHFLACLCVGFLFRFWKYHDTEKILPNQTKSTTSSSIVNFSNLGEVLATSILNAIHTIILIGGFVILFSVVLSILNHSGFFAFVSFLLAPIFQSLHLDLSFIQALASGMIELTNGLSLITNIATKAISTNIVFSSFLLGFGGISVLLQVLSITSKSDISIKAYFFGKLLHGGIAAILTYLFTKFIPFFNFDIAEIFSPSAERVNLISSYTNLASILIGSVMIIFTLFLFLKKKKQIKV